MLQHVSDHRRSIIREPCTVLGQNGKNGSIPSVDMDVVGVMAAYCNPLCVCVVHCIGRPSYSELYTHKGSEYAAIIPTTSMSTGTIESFF